MKSRKRVALVTGGCGEIGSAICKSLSRAGLKVIVADLDAARCEAVAKQVSGHAVQMDVAEPDAVTGAVREVFERAGRIDVCVNAAGWEEHKPFLETDEIYSAKVLEINLAGPIRVARAVLPGMKKSGWGRIINIASESTGAGAVAESIFAAATAGVIALTKSIAREFAGEGVTANAVCPGPTETPSLPTTDGSSRDRSEDMRPSVPIPHVVIPADVAPAVAFLASDDAAFITGQTLSVGGGLTTA